MFTECNIANIHAQTDVLFPPNFAAKTELFMVNHKAALTRFSRAEYATLLN
jgi:hypothetical protein